MGVNVLSGLLWLYAICTCLFLLLRIVIGERWWVIGLLNSFYPVIMLMAFPLIGIAVFGNDWWLVLALCIPALAFIINYGPSFIPRQQMIDPQITTITLLTWNVHAEEIYLAQMVELIRSTDADIICLQELEPAAADCFATALEDIYPFQALHPGANDHAGQGVVSRYPLENDRYWRNPLHRNVMGHQAVRVKIAEKFITIYNTHPLTPLVVGSFYDDRIRSQELAITHQRAAQESDPVIILGDFNMSDQSNDYRLFAAQFVDTYREVGIGLGFTFPDYRQPQAHIGTGIPRFMFRLMRLDYIFHSPKRIQGIEIKVWPGSGGSDHHPIWARLAIKG